MSFCLALEVLSTGVKTEPPKAVDVPAREGEVHSLVGSIILRKIDQLCWNNSSCFGKAKG